LRTILKFTNTRGESVSFNKAGSFFNANKIEGFGDVDADIQTQKSPYQDGSSFTDALFEERFIGFEVSIIGSDDTDISNKRSQLAGILNPKLGEGLLEVTYGSVVRMINAIAESVPKYPSGNDNRGLRFQVGLVNLRCPNPYWRSNTITEEPAFESLFSFPFEGDVLMGMQRDQRIISNDGNSPAPLFVEFFGPALNPVIINNTTGEYIKVNQELFEGERMMIDTSDDNKSVYFVDATGVERNVFNWIDLNSTFFKLVVGENDIEYTADSDIQGAVVNISYNKLYNAI